MNRYLIACTALALLRTTNQWHAAPVVEYSLWRNARLLMSAESPLQFEEIKASRALKDLIGCKRSNDENKNYSKEWPRYCNIINVSAMSQAVAFERYSHDHIIVDLIQRLRPCVTPYFCLETGAQGQQVVRDCAVKSYLSCLRTHADDFDFFLARLNEAKDETDLKMLEFQLVNFTQDTKLRSMMKAFITTKTIIIMQTVKRTSQGV